MIQQIVTTNDHDFQTARYSFYLLLLILILRVHTANECSLKSAKNNYWAVLSGRMHACYVSVYTSIYLCCSFWYIFENSLLIKGSLVCFTLEIYNLSISFRNWTTIYNESIKRSDISLLELCPTKDTSTRQAYSESVQ